MLHYTQLVVAIALILVTSTRGGSDATDDKVQQARDAYAKKVADAKLTLLNHYERLLSSLANNAKLDESVKFRDELKVFIADGILIGRADLKAPMQEYGQTLKSARDELAAVFQDAIQEYTKALRLERAQELRRESNEKGLGARLVSLQLVTRRGLYIQHANYEGVVRRAVTEGDKLNATFELVQGLASADCVSIRSANCPDHYLAHGNMRIRMGKLNEDETARKNATFRQVRGLAKNTDVSFESVNYPGYYVRAKGDQLYIDKYDGTLQFVKDATFVVSEPLFKLW